VRGQLKRSIVNGNRMQVRTSLSDVTDVAKWEVSKRILFKNLVNSCQ
jgi:hypothetical protein